MAQSNQCDQMARLFPQFWPVFNNEKIPIAFKVGCKYYQIQINRRKLSKDFKKFRQSGKILSNPVTVVVAQSNA